MVYFPETEKVNDFHDWITNHFTGQVLSNSRLSTKLKEEITKLSVERLLKIILDAAGRLDKEEKYEDVVRDLSRNISKNYRNLPEKLSAIYQFIQKDIKPLKLNSKELRDKAIADGAMSTILF